MLMTDLHLLLSDSSVFLISPWKPLVIWGLMAWWAWLVATRIQQDATYYRFRLELWNLAFMTFGVLGLGIMLFGWMFWVSLPVGMLVLFAPVLIYWRQRNMVVPEDKKFAISLARTPEAKEKKAAKRALRDVTPPVHRFRQATGFNTWRG